MSGSAGPAGMDGDDDVIEDDYDSYDELFTQHFTDEKLSRLDGPEAVPVAQDGPPTSSQQNPVNSIKRFLARPSSDSKPQTASTSAPCEEKVLPWAQRFAPRNLEELAVHKRKVRDVEQWLNEAFAGKRHRNLLVLKGPAGSGKTTTISLLSDKLNYSILEWKAPSTSVYEAQDYVSLGARFDAFLSRGHEFDSLDLDNNGSGTPIQRNDDAPQRRIISIEEFPTLTGRPSSLLAAFQLSILRYISMNDSAAQRIDGSEAEIPPIVMVVSETSSNSDSFSENLTVHRLLGRRLYNHPSTTIIEFNSIASTIMQKALNLVLKRSACQPFGNQAQTRSIISNISKIGDIRSAIASLEFLCLGSGHQHPWNDQAVRNTHTNRTRKKSNPVSNEALEEISQRESSIGLYHAVGKIVYNKRDDTLGTEHLQLPSPPDHLQSYDRPKASQVDVNELSDQTGTDTQAFIGALHENYVPSCNGSSFTESLDGCIQSLSNSDMLCVDRKGNSRSQAGFGTSSVGFGAGVDLLRQEEISYQVAARGLLFALPSPVQRQISTANHTKRTDSAYKLFFSPANRLFRQFEEAQGLIDSWGDALLSSALRPIARLLRNRDTATSFEPIHTTEVNPQGDDKETCASVVAMLSRKELILHQLPYMSLILCDAPGSRDLERVIGFPETRSLLDDRSRQEEPPFESPTEGFNALGKCKRDKRITHCEAEAALVSKADDEQLILSDDDIVDDL